MARPSDDEFSEWVENNSNVVKIRSALKKHPDLINIKNRVSLWRYVI